MADTADKETTCKEIIYAYVTYKDQPKKHYTVRLSTVKSKRNSKTHISATSDTDFDKRRVYYVKWTDCGSACQKDHAHFGYYPAYIHYLGVSVDHIASQIKKGGRLTIPSGLPSSESEENFKPIRSQKQTNLQQAVQRQKNLETLNKLKSNEFLSSRKPLTHDSGDEDENEDPDNTNGNVNEVGPKDTQKELDIEHQPRARVRQDLFGETSNSSNLVKSVDQGRLSSRKPLIHDSGYADENEDPDNTNGNVNEVGPKDTQKELDIEHQPRARVRRDLFGETSNSSNLVKSVDQVKNTAQPKDCGRESEKPAITRIQNVNYKLSKFNEQNVADGSGTNCLRNKNSIEIGAEDLIAPGPSQQYRRQNSPVAVTGKFKRKNPENQNQALHVDPPDDNDNDSLNEDEERGNKERLPLREKRRKRQIEGGLTKRSHREVHEALEYFKNPEPDPDQKKMYEIADEQIYLWEGITVPASVWFLIKQNKPQIFFGSMIEMLWPSETLINRCQNLKKVTTRLVGRSPMKELTPRKKRLSYKLYADYLDEKKIKGAEKLACLVKVPYLITTKINYLRGRYYE